MRDFAEGETIMEYTGEVISWQEAQDRHPHDPSNPNHTFYFHIDDTRVIDGLRKGNSAKWINHSCDGNCEADEVRGRIFIKALRNIKSGEELHYDYGLVTDEPLTRKLKAQYPCWCGSKNCRGTLLSPKERKETPKIPSQKKSKAKVKVKAETKVKVKSKDKAKDKAAKVVKPVKLEKPKKVAKAAKDSQPKKAPAKKR